MKINAVIASALVSLFTLAACEENKVDNATCYVDITDSANVTAEVKSDITGEILVRATNFGQIGTGNMQASHEDVDVVFAKDKNIPFLTLRFNRAECRLSKIEYGFTYPMELIGGKLPELTPDQ